MIINTTSLRDFILTNYSQLELFSKYSGISEGDILNCIHNNKKVNNIMRNEENASLTFTYYDNRLRMHDYGSNEYRGDIFDLVGLIVGESSGTRKGFINICKYIINNGNISNLVTHPSISKKDKDTIIKFNARNWNTKDLDFWMVGLHTNQELLRNQGVYCVNDATILTNNEFRYQYYNKTDDPCYAYFFDSINNKNLIKLYFSNRNKDKKYITNNKYDFEGINSLYKTKYLVITKGYKERVILRNYLPNDYCVTNFSSESVLLTREQIAGLLTIYKKIFINVDYDYAGIINAFYHYFRYNPNYSVNDTIKPVFINNEIITIKDDSKITSLYNKLLLTSPNLPKEQLIQKLNMFINKYVGEYEEKDFFDLAKVISPNVMKEYIKYKFKIS